MRKDSLPLKAERGEESVTILGFHIFHKWSKWTECLVKHSSILFRYESEPEQGQKRVCEECGLEDIR